jgi:hypothetical protein
MDNCVKEICNKNYLGIRKATILAHERNIPTTLNETSGRLKKRDEQFDVLAKEGYKIPEIIIIVIISRQIILTAHRTLQSISAQISSLVYPSA